MKKLVDVINRLKTTLLVMDTRHADCMAITRTDIVEMLELLNASEPVEPILDIRHGKSMWRCGSCATALQPNQMNARFCFNCGKAVKWE